MLRIHSEERPDPDVLTLRLEGKLLGPWVGELLQAWAKLEEIRPAKAVIRIDLNAVSYVDSLGRGLLASLHDRGCRLTGTGTFIAAVIDECSAAKAPGTWGKR